MQFSFQEARIDNLQIHKVGNKTADEECVIGNDEVILTEELTTLLEDYFLTPFTSEAGFRFQHDIELPLNEVYNCLDKIFENPDSLNNNSAHLATHLYNNTSHPKIKGGEFYVVYFKDCILDGEKMDAIGLFKSENKDTFLEIEQVATGFGIETRKGINIKKLDKGALVFKTEKEAGYIVAIVDNTNRGTEAQYWRDDFLNVAVLNNDFNQTNEFLGITKKFVTNQLTEDFEVSKADQIDLLNRSVEYFKENETFEQEDFEKEVFQDESVRNSFKNFDESYRTEHDIELEESFDISAQAVKKQARVFKSVLKLDKNFHIYIHGDTELIQQGVDNDGRKFYKIYYKDEN